MNEKTLQIITDPLLPWPVIALLALAAAVLMLGAVLSLMPPRTFSGGASMGAARKGWLIRTLLAALLLCILINPVSLRETREPLSGVVTIVTDESPSQSIGQRATRTQGTLESLRERLQTLGGVEVRTVFAGEDGRSQETTLFDDLGTALGDVPPGRRSGVIFLSDGRIHDIPAGIKNAAQMYAPVHLFLSGLRNERDSSLYVANAPGYGLVGESVSLELEVRQTSNIDRARASLIIDIGGGARINRTVPVNERVSIDLPIRHAGENVFDIAVKGVEDELSMRNNRVAIGVNGIRERLKVLLVSGKPYAGTMTWRGLLSQDAGVDLVHFTILRQPEKFDPTPQNEMALIRFPFDELFDKKLYDFDLIIFDRYQRGRILPGFYFENIARYVRQGGAFLAVTGPDYASENSSIHETALSGILPAAPAGGAVEAPFTPALTATGERHPVTRPLVDPGDGEDGSQNGVQRIEWGPWMRYMPVRGKGEPRILLRSPDTSPLLLLDRIGEGRSAVLATDQLWLWQRGYDGGGPYRPLLRRLAHWLMKEPELEENALDIAVDGMNITVQRRTLGTTPPKLQMKEPDGTIRTLSLEKQPHGWFGTRVTAPQKGIYEFTSPATDKSRGGGAEDLRRFAIVGQLNPPEFMEITTSDKPMTPLLQASGGHSYWMADDTLPDIRLKDGQDRVFGGTGWLGLKQTRAASLKNIKQSPLVPPWLALITALVLLLVLWRVEGAGPRPKRDSF